MNILKEEGIGEDDTGSSSSSRPAWKRGDAGEQMFILKESGNEDALYDSDVSVDIDPKEVKQLRKEYKKQTNKLRRL